MKALILNSKVVDVKEAEFEVHESMTWVDCDNTVVIGDSYDGSTFTSNQQTAEEIAAAQAIVDQRATDRANGNQKLLDLGLTQAEATALTGYTPPSE